MWRLPDGQRPAQSQSRSRNAPLTVTASQAAVRLALARAALLMSTNGYVSREQPPVISGAVESAPPLRHQFAGFSAKAPAVEINVFQFDPTLYETEPDAM